MTVFTRGDSVDGRILPAMFVTLALALAAGCRGGDSPEIQPTIDAEVSDPDAFDGGGPLDEQVEPAGDPVPGGPEAPPASPVPAAPPESPASPAAPVSPPRRAAGATQLTEPGCCAAPSWTADGERVVFLDRRSDVTAFYGVHIDRPGEVEVAFQDVAAYSAGFDYRLDPLDQGVRVTRLAKGDVWDVPTGDRPVVISPDGEVAAWSEFNRDAEPENRRTRLRVARRGGPAETVAELGRGSLSGWLGDSHLLASRRPNPSSETDELIVVDLESGAHRLLVATERLRGASVAPGGERIAAHATGNGPLIGLLVVDVGSGDVSGIPDDLFGAYRWRDAERLLIIPMQPGPRHRLVEYDVVTGSRRDLVTEDGAPFKVANGDWAVAPGGDRIVWVEAADKSLWIRELPQ